MLTLADKFTLSRVAAVPVLVILLYFTSRLTCLAAFLVFLLASLTDMLDGMIARRTKTVSNFGKFLDPLADKVLVLAALVMLVQLGWVEAFVVIIILTREIAVTGLRAMASDNGIVIPADRYGKLKTITQIAALCPLLLHYPWLGFDPAPAGEIILYIALVLTVFSGINYWRSFNAVYSREKHPRFETSLSNGQKDDER